MSLASRRGLLDRLITRQLRLGAYGDVAALMGVPKPLLRAADEDAGGEDQRPAQDYL